MRRARALMLATAVAVMVVGSAGPAGAHSLTGTQATNYETRIFGIAPHYAGVTVKVLDLGGRIELRNTSGHEVEVLGYQGEPYLEVGPSGVLRNRRSPATFLNQTKFVIPGPIPASYDAKAAPVWQRLSSGRTVSWHDHRTHWMLTTEPPIVQRDPHERHVIIPHWVVPLRVDGQPVALTGEVLWVPGPSPWPWLLLVVAALFAVIGVSFTRVGRPGVAVALTVGGISAAGLAVGAWRYSTGSLPAHLGTTVYEIGAMVLVSITVVLLARKRRFYDVSPLMLFTGVVLAIGAGLANVTSLWRSQLPTMLSNGLARVLIALCVGVGVGVVVVAALNLGRRDPTRRRTAAGARVVPPVPGTPVTPIPEEQIL
jgi:hypothetical protein